MVNINLATADDLQPQRPKYKTGLLVIIILLVLLMAFYGWIRVNSANINRKISQAEREINNQTTRLTESEENRQVINFENRLLASQILFNERNDAIDSLLQIQKRMIQGTYLTNLSIDQASNRINLQGIADDFNLVARQVASFKSPESAEFFSGVIEGETSVNDKGKVSFDLDLIIK